MSRHSDGFTHRLNTAALYRMMDAKRRSLKMSWRDVAAEIDCSPSGNLFSRMKKGGSDVGISSSALISILVWVGYLDGMDELVLRQEQD